jgi:transcription elongation factor Elf1
MAQREPQQYIWVGLFGLSHEIPGADGEAIVLLDVRYRVEIRFQCPSCGQDLQHTTRLLQAKRHMSCRACGVRIHIDTNRLADGAEEFNSAIGQSPARNHDNTFLLDPGADNIQRDRSYGAAWFRRISTRPHDRSHTKNSGL